MEVEGGGIGVSVLVMAAYASVRSGLRAMLEGAEGIGSVAESSLESESVLARSAPDAVVYDVNEPDWLAPVAQVRTADAALVLLSDDPATGQAALREPWRGLAWLHKDVDREELVSAVRAVASGLVVLDRVSLRGALGHPSAAAERAELSARELQVLQLMSEGLPNKQIAQRLGISNSTAKFHVASVLTKLDATSRTEAVTVGLRRGLIAV